MKKTIFRMTGLLFLLITMIGLAACGSEETVKLQGEQLGQNIEITLEAKDDEIQSIAAEVAQPYSALGVESKEEAEKMDDIIQSQFTETNEEGVEFGVNYEEEEIIITINIDFTVADPEALNTLGFGSFEDEDLSLEKAVSEMEDAGLEVVE